MKIIVEVLRNMAKSLIYMGRVGDKYRVALFDSNNPLARRLPVKDVPMLPTNVEYLNCSVIDGQVVPSLEGAKIICAVSRKHCPNPDMTTDRDIELRSLWVDRKQEPKYLYGYTGYSLDYKNKRMRFYPSSMLASASAWNFWDELCTENTFYLIAVLAVRKSTKRFNLVSSFLAMDSKGNLHFTNANDMRICMNAGIRYVQVGSPRKLSFPSVYSHSRLCTGSIPLVAVDTEDEKRIIWHGLKKLNELDPKPVEFVWWNPSWRTTICDFRKYINGKAFGINSAADASVVIYPEGAEQIWFGFMQFCPSLKMVYVPPSVETIYDYGIPVRNVKKITVYSSSPAAVEFCNKYGVERVDCTDAEEMMNKFYAAAGGDYVSAADASNIASLAGAQSNVTGEGGTVWSAALFSLSSKGFATETLHEKYPIIDLCKGRFEKPKDIQVVTASTIDGSCIPSNDYGEEVIRTFIGALIQFYPYTEKPMTSSWSKIECVKYALGEYSLYLGLFGFANKHSGKSIINLPQNMYYRASREYFKEVAGDLTKEHHVALLVNPAGEVIHRFACPLTFVRVLKTLSAVITTGKEPCGVLRYADKLPSIHRWSWGVGSDVKQVRDALVHSFLVFSYHTKKAKRMMVGIDLHSGSLATAEYTTHGYEFGVITPSQGGQRDTFYVSVNRLSRIQLYPEDADLRELFPDGCLYNKGR